DSGLQTPMYFFLRHLALTDFGYSTAMGPKMLANFVVDQNSISYHCCATQLAFFLLFIACEPLCGHLQASAVHCPVMSSRLCWVLVPIPYPYCTFVSLPATMKNFPLSFCRYNVISHFYCDSLSLLSLVCSDKHEGEVMMLTLAAFNLISSFLVVLVSSLLIFAAILRMNSTEGRRKAFSTCGSHLTVVTVFYGTLIFMYVQPKVSIFYTLIIPMLNPLTYSLRSKDVKYSLQKAQKKLCNIFS
uniref:G-protein coupled receptors family 1 profile domain-containing protein n=1 Tax=Chinchilla lanigera TaxID=34839 RepID=A0A8C2YS18_CHILA